MKLKIAQIKDFKRFTDLTISEIPVEAKLIVLVGPNGIGKTSLFEAFKQWSGRRGSGNYDSDNTYLGKNSPNFNNLFNQNIKIEFYGSPPQSPLEFKRSFYFRSAYRNEADFIANNITQVGSVLDEPRLARLIDNDSTVSANYKRIVSTSLQKLYDRNHDNENIKTVREELIGEIRRVIQNLFGDLILENLGDPLKDGSFYFTKGLSENFLFKNLSAGEKAAFDIITDFIIKKTEFNDTIYCIDEPELHLHTRLQAALLEEIFKLIPDNSQLFISTHSIGMIHKAVELNKLRPNEVVFLDFHGTNTDEKIELKPVEVSRETWKRTLAVALDDLADLVSPKRIVLCEGRPTNLNSRNKEFDASVYRKIFNEGFSDTDFISIGSEKDVRAQKIDVVSTLGFLNKGIAFIKVIDRDDRSDQEISDTEENEGVKVLRQRDIENYLYEDEIIIKLCNKIGQHDAVDDCLKIKQDAIQESISRQNPQDDIKSAAGKIYTELKKRLGLTQCGNTVETFTRDTMAPLVTPETFIYQKLKTEIFG